MPRRFLVGDSVRWVHAVPSPEFKNAVGVVEFVNPNDTNVDELTLYDIRFPFGTQTLYGTQLESAAD
jgi:hypothetical protein